MKQCNKCGFVGHLDYFIKSKGYKDGHRPLCKLCKFIYQRKRLGKEIIDWTPRFSKKEAVKKQEYVKHKLNITEEGLNVLITNGFARNREEALRYIQ